MAVLEMIDGPVGIVLHCGREDDHFVVL